MEETPRTGKQPFQLIVCLLPSRIDVRKCASGLFIRRRSTKILTLRLLSLKLAPFLRVRRQRPLLMIDWAMPRDIDPAVYKLDDVYLYDLDSLQSMAERTLAVRKQELGKMLSAN